MAKRRGFWLGVFRVALVVLALSWVVRVEAATLTDLETIWGTAVFAAPEWTATRLVDLFATKGIPLTSAQAQHIVDLESAGLLSESHTYTMGLQNVQLALGISDSAAEASKLAESSNLTANVVMRNLALPAVTTKKEKEQQDKAAKGSSRARLLDAQLRYEHVRFEDDDSTGNVYGASLGVAMDKEKFTYGAIVPYDYARIEHTDIHRLGAILFGQYHLKFSEQLQSSVTVDLPLTQLNVGEGGDNLNTYGAGGGINLLYDAGTIVPSLAVQYQYSKDDRNQFDYHHLFSTGGNIGFRVGDLLVINGFSIWNHDASDYLSDINGDADYFDLGLEMKYTPTDSFTLSLGYKKILGLYHIESDMLYLGALGHF